METLRQNSRIFSQLGLGQMNAMLSVTGVTKEPAAPKDPDPLYQPQDEDLEQEAADKETMLDLEPEPSDIVTTNARSNTGGSRSKRVMAMPDEQNQPARITRKRARELTEHDEGSHVLPIDPQDGATDQELVDLNAHTQSDNHDMNREDPCVDKRRMGKGLDKMSRGSNNKLKVHIAEGNKRPEAPVQAAKLASEAGIFIRDHIPILSHWKDYKDDAFKDVLDDYMVKIGMQFDIDIRSQPVIDACMDILKNMQKNMRCMLKNKYFNDIPANQVRTTSPLASTSDEQSKALVEMWSTSRHKERCEKAKNSRGEVKLQQKTGSRPYVAHCYTVETHCSSKKGFSEDAKNAIAQMEAKAAAPPQEGQEAVTPFQAILQVIPKSTFFRNLGMPPATSKIGTKGSEVDARVLELEKELMSEKEGSAAVRA